MSWWSWVWLSVPAALALSFLVGSVRWPLERLARRDLAPLPVSYPNPGRRW
jgi:hypothetical protein